MIDLQSINQALIASEQLSFRRAAATLGVRQSVVSRRIRALEDELGVSLFERSSRGLRVTDAGQRFLGRAQRAIRDLDEAIRGAGSAGCGLQGCLRIGIFSSLASGFLRELLVTFIRNHPDVAVDVREGAPRDHIAQVWDRKMDVTLVTGAPDTPGCDVETLWEERVFAVLPVGHVLASRDQVGWRELRNECFVVSRDEPGPEIHDYLIRRLAELSFHPSVRRFDVCRETLMHLVAIGMGISLTSEATVATNFPDVVFRNIAGTEDVLPFSCVWSPANDNPALRRFISLARTIKGRRGPLRQMEKARP